MLLAVLVLLLYSLDAAAAQTAVECFSTQECLSGRSNGFVALDDCCRHGVQPFGLSYILPGEAACHLCPVEFGFVQDSFTAVERTEEYQVELAVFSGSPELGPFFISLQFNAGTATDRDIGLTFQRIFVPQVVEQADLQIVSATILLRLDSVAQEGDETFTLTFTFPPEALGANPILHDTFSGVIVDATPVAFEFSEEDYREREGDTGFMPVIITKNSQIFLANSVLFAVIPLTISEAEDQGLIPDEITVPSDSIFSPNRADEFDFNTSAITAIFPRDEAIGFPLTDLFAPIAISDDEIDESNEQYFLVRLEVVDAVNPNLITLQTRTSRCRIIDNDPISIGFQQSVYEYFEPALLPIVVDNVTLIKDDDRISEQTFGLLLTFSDPGMGLNAATPRTMTQVTEFDYAASDTGETSLLVLFTPEMSTLDVSILLNADNLVEGTEGFEISVDSQGEPFPRFQSSSSSFSTTIVRIIDSDIASTDVHISFESSSYTFLESDGTGTIRIRKIGISPNPIRIRVFGGPSNQSNVVVSAEGLEDREVEFSGGSSEEFISISIAITDDNAEQETTEMYIAFLEIISSVGNVLVGNFSMTVINILDDDVTIPQEVSCYSTSSCASGNFTGTATVNDCCQHGIAPFGLAYAIPGQEQCFACPVEFGFVQETFTGRERDEIYEVEVAFFSGRAPFGGFLLPFQFLAGTASENADVSLTFTRTFIPQVVEQSELQTSSIQLLFRQDLVSQEENETFMLTFTVPSGVLGSNPTLHDTFSGVVVDATPITFGLSEESYREREGDTGFMPVIISKDSDVLLASPVMLIVTPLTINQAEARGLIPEVVTVEPDDQFSPNRADRNDFNATVIVTTFPADEGDSVETDLSVPIGVYDDSIDEANEQFFIVSLEVADAVTVDLIRLEQRASVCRIIDNDAIRIGFQMDVYTHFEPTIPLEFFSEAALIKEDGRLSEQTFGVRLTFVNPGVGFIAATIQQSEQDTGFDYAIGRPGENSILLVFPPERSLLNVTYLLASDNLAEGIEAFRIVVSSQGEPFPNFLTLPAANDAPYPSALITIFDSGDSSSQLISCFRSTSCSSESVTGTASIDDCCRHGVAPIGLAYTVPGTETCFECPVEFGFVQESLTGVERERSYEVEVAFFSGKPAWGGFFLTLRYNAGTANEDSDVRFTFNRVFVPEVEPQDDLQISSANILFRLDSVAQEENETFTLTFSNTPGTIGPNATLHNTFTGVIVDATPITFGLSEESYREREGDTGFMPVIISKDSDMLLASPVMLIVTPLTINQAEARGLIPEVVTVEPDDQFSPNRADRNDFNATVIVTTFPADEGNSVETDLSVPIGVYDDSIDEANEQFFIVSLEVADAVTVSLIRLEQRASVCRIIDNDAIRIGFQMDVYTHFEPTIPLEFFSEAALIKEDGRLSEQTFGVRLTFGNPGVGLNAATIQPLEQGSGFDYAIGRPGENSILLVFPPYRSLLNVTYLLASDNLAEGIEAFRITVSSQGEPFPNFFTLSAANDAPYPSALITILDSGGAPPVVVEFSPANYVVTEGGIVEFILALSNSSFEVVTVEVVTVSNTADAGDYFGVGNLTITFSPGTVRASFEVMTVLDRISEGPETFDAIILGATGAAIGSNDEAIATIIDQAIVTLRPNHGNQLGGTPVIVEGLPLEPTDFVRCIFDGIAVFGAYLDSSSALCVTPIMNTQGVVDVEVTIFRGLSRETFSTKYTNLSPIRAYSVDFSIESSSSNSVMDLYFGVGDRVRLTWLPEELLPKDIAFTSSSAAVNIHLFQFRDRPRLGNDRSSWYQIHEIRSVPNTGLFDVEIPQDIVLDNCLGQNEACPVAFRISAVAGARVEVSGDIEIELPEGTFAGVWSAVAFLQASQATSISLSNICDQWAQPSNRILGSRLRQLPACPRTLRQAVRDARFQLEASQSIATRLTTQYDQNSRRFYTPMASTCYVQTVMEGSVSDVGHQCCYDVEGRLVTGQGGGSIDKVSPLTSFTNHLMEDLLPYAFCCHGGLRCDLYDEFRPSRLEDEPVFILPIPACVYGDPHLVTLDGHRYTFNGKGEFTLVETHDNIITVQGRMEQAVDSSGNTAPGTVFTSIVAHQAGDVERTVEFQVNQQGGLDILVDRGIVDFTDLLEQSFQQVVVIRNGSNSGVAEFSEGANIRVDVENGIISVMLITLPERYNSLTSGLMGNFNGDETDDFIPRGSTASMPADSSAEEIFSFGNTWTITESTSLFAYNRPGESFASFLDPDFTPAFEPEFDDPELQQRADEICGGDQACLFDVAATKNEDIGMATMMGIMDFETIVETAQPIVCDPPCDQGVCVATNNCSCAMGYSGPRCTQRVERDCDSNVCQNGGTCVQHARSISCSCPEGLIGIFCQEEEPPLSLRLINSSPRITGRMVSVDFIPSQPLSSARCILINQTEEDCLSGRARFRNLAPGSYILDIEAETAAGERVVERRTVFVCDAESGSCGVNLINEGVTVSGDCARLQFTGCFFCNSYACRLDGGSFVPCRSPLQYCGLEPGLHSIQIVPTDPDCAESQRLTRSFTIF